LSVGDRARRHGLTFFGVYSTIGSTTSASASVLHIPSETLSRAPALTATRPCSARTPLDASSYTS